MIVSIDSLYTADYIHTVFDLMRDDFTTIHALHIVRTIQVFTGNSAYIAG